MKPIHDPAKPTVTVVLGSEVTEGLDFTIPYEIFSRTGAFNVYAVAEDTQVKSLTRGLDVILHYSFREMDELLYDMQFEGNPFPLETYLHLLLTGLLAGLAAYYTDWRLFRRVRTEEFDSAARIQGGEV
ncbi:hypothetical protein [Ammoniphilus sp. YIM 78166]|uniref:hypothetical protein n=1 Tax=Ammoniphilus sp. YIM 78166 TaxID=1644106 RepID=UPI00107032A8|nr:hypothetical protein [Ammoniphilus sp. YIM 78166]